MMNSRIRILLKVTGSISAYKAAYLASRLVQAGYHVKTIFSKSAHQFVGSMTFEGLTREKVWDSNFEPGHAMAHIDLARWADLTLVYPASANTISKLANGDGTDLVGTLFLAHDFKNPYWLAPAMNPSMLMHPTTLHSLDKLEEFGVEIIESPEGRMACGEEGVGRLIEPEEMFQKIEKHFKTQNPKKILITAGGTTEPIDSVRSITNMSTGETGVKLAYRLARRGHSVTLLLSANSKYEIEGVNLIRFTSCADLDLLVQERLKNNSYDTVIHAAAVSDFFVESILDEKGNRLDPNSKIPSDRGISLNLKRNPKIVSQMKTISKNQNMKLISFKLTVGTDQFESNNYASSDLIVQNEASRIERTTDRHEGALYAKASPNVDVFSKVHLFRSKQELFSILEKFIETDLEKVSTIFEMPPNVHRFPEVQL